jgi:hypothetical protein
MTRRRKIVVALLATTVIGIAATGCAETPEESSASDEPAAVETDSPAEEETAEEKQESANDGKFTATIKGVPQIQVVGMEYVAEIRVKNKGAAIENFCFDFDDNGAWVIQMVGMEALANDTFCKTLEERKEASVFRAVLLPGEAGTQTLEVLLGKGDITAGEAFITDEYALSWSQEVVIG